MMNKKISFFILSAFFANGMNAEVSENNERLVNFFTESLKGSNDCFKSKKRIKISKLKSNRQNVWDAWCEANNNFDEEKLIRLSPLAEAQQSSWHLPDSLENNAVMNYYFGSKGEKPSEGYPLFLYIHGSGNKDREWATGLKICNRFEDSPSMYFIPQIPNTGKYYRWWQKAKQFAWERLLRQAFVNGYVNPEKVYFFGISEGGYGSQRLASFYADYLAAAGPMAGGEPLRNAPAENCRNIGFSLLTGNLDDGFYRNTLTSYAKAVYDSLQHSDSSAYSHRIELIPDRGHSIDYSPTTPWLRNYERNPYPKHVVWEDFEMDGLHRDGFYNLYVLKRPESGNDNRTRYIVDIKDNKIDINADFVEYTVLEKDPQWGIELKYSKKFVPASGGRILLYLNEELIDFDRKVSVSVNGKEVFDGKVKMELKHLVNSCVAYFDPMRLYPAAIEVDF